MFKISVLVTAGLLWATASSAQDKTQEFTIGQDEYQKACAACHGGSAVGNGELAAMFKSPIPDLMGIAKRNDGVFPLLSVIQAIDGRAVIRGHGNSMPVFGNRYRAEADSRSMMFGSEAIARGRVLELALHIQSIQE
jgi:mono/diheme cytochrome c family protein